MYSHRALRVVVCFAALALLPHSALAQDWNQPWSDPRDRPPRVDLSVSAGVIAPTDWSDLVVLGTISPFAGALEQVLVRDLRIEPERVYGASVTYWQDRYGFRANAAFSESSLVGGHESLENQPVPGEFRVAGVDTWFYDVRGAIGLVKYSPTRRVWPYVFLGFGGVTYNLDRTITPPLLTFIARPAPGNGSTDELVVVEDDGRSFLLSIDELGLETVFSGNFGVGTDLRLPLGGAGLGVRLELGDTVAPSPLKVRIRELSRTGGLTSDSTVGFGVVHHLRFSVGLVVQIGR